MNIKEEIIQSFKTGNALTKLIYINLGVFLFIKLMYVALFLFNVSGVYESFIKLLAVPASLSSLIVKPWTLITYMFLHENFLHILFNLLWLFWFGRVFVQYLGSRKLTGVYILGGIAGAGLYIFSYNVFPVFRDALDMSYALGASAAVMAIAVAIAFHVPDYRFHLIFIGPVKIIYIVLFFIFTDILTIASYNPGGHIAHLGGALTGYWFVRQYAKGKDISRGINNLLDKGKSLFKKKKKMKVTYNRKMTDMEYNKYKAEQQKQLDDILDKIAKNGYDSLSKKEKETLFRIKNN